MKDFGVGFKCSVRSNPYEKEKGDSAVMPIVCGFLILLLIGGMFLFKIVLGSSEPFLNYYDLKVNKTQSLEIHKGCYVYFAPITTAEACVGEMPEDVVLYDVLTYVAIYENYEEPDSYIGIDAGHLRQYLGESSDFVKDRDGIVWISKARIRILS